MTASSDDDQINTETALIHKGRPDGKTPVWPVVNEPLYRTSTVLYEKAADMKVAAGRPYGDPYYGRRGTPTKHQFESLVGALEGSKHVLAVSCGLQAITLALLAFLEEGDHIIISDHVYDPTRKFADKFLARMGIETTYVPPMCSEDELIIAFRTNTKLVMTEAPGSGTFEVPDIPMMCRVAHERNALVIIDNTWATGYFLDVFALGVDVSLVAATKYICGHADAMMGTVSTNDDDLWRKIFATNNQLGLSVSSDDCYLAARGMRTLAVRLDQHEANALALAQWLSDQPEVIRVLHPAFPDCPGHEFWKRDFEGSSGLFSICMDPAIDQAAINHLLDSATLFGLGFSWGGFESLFIEMNNLDQSRTAAPFPSEGALLRVHAGLESIDDLIDNLDQAFTALRAFRGQ